jgi:hypothetical protein
MNSLSWPIYAADVAGTAKTVAAALLIGLPLSAVLGAMFFPLASLMAEDLGLAPAVIHNWLKGLVKGATIAFVAAGVVTVFVPSNGTLYAIAASEMGEEVLNSETGGKAVEALNAWLDRQIGKPAQ